MVSVNYNNQYIARKFVNLLMMDGKKIKAERLLQNALLVVKKRESVDPMQVFLKALSCCKPSVEIRSVRRGGASYQIPVPLKEYRGISLSMKWIIQVARKRKGPFHMNLAVTLLEASKNQGDSVKKKDSIHMIALKNRSLTHFRWF